MITDTITDLLSVAQEHEQRKALGFSERSGIADLHPNATTGSA